MFGGDSKEVKSCSGRGLPETRASRVPADGVVDAADGRCGDEAGKFREDEEEGFWRDPGGRPRFLLAGGAAMLVDAGELCSSWRGTCDSARP